MNGDDQQIVPGLSVSTTGQATVDPSIADVLFDLAIKLEETTTLPVDVQHVVAALVLSAPLKEPESAERRYRLPRAA